MSAQQVAGVLSAQGRKVFANSARYVEATFPDADGGSTVRVRFIFDEAVPPTIKAVEFVADDAAFVQQHKVWRSRLTASYGNQFPQESGQNVVRDNFCHGRNVSVALALFPQRAVMAYFYNPGGAASCQRAIANPRGDAVAYDPRPAGVGAKAPPATTTSGSPQSAGASAQVPSVKTSHERPAVHAAKGPSPLAYAPNRSAQYQLTLRCIGVAAYSKLQARDGASAASWEGQVRRLTNLIVGIGRNEGLTPQQMNAEGREIVARNHISYRQNAKDSRGNLYLDSDLAHCRASGLLPS